MSLARMYTKPGHLIRRLQQAAVGAFLAEVGDHNLTPVQYATLCGIHESDGLDIKGLAEIVALDRSTLGSTITRLAERGLIERVENARDRRSRLLRILPPGVELLQKVEPMVRAAQVRMLERIPPDDRERFVALLTKLVDLNNEHSRAPLKESAGDGASLSFHAKPGHLIRRLQQISDAMFAEISAEFSITPVQYASLVAINEYPGLDNTRLSYLVALDRATVGSVVERLEKKRWILRQDSDVDRRAKSLTITPAGQALLVEMQPSIARAETRITAPLSRQEQRTFMHLLASVVNLTNDFSRAPQRWVDLGPPA